VLRVAGGRPPSRRIISEDSGSVKSIKVEINDPWRTLRQQVKKPNPRIKKWPPGPNTNKGTTIRVYGHPPYRTEPFIFDELYYYLKHRTFAGFTRERPNAPRIVLKALLKSELALPCHDSPSITSPLPGGIM